MTSPLAIVPRARQVIPEIELLTKCTDPLTKSEILGPVIRP